MRQITLIKTQLGSIQLYDQRETVCICSVVLTGTAVL